jgi:integrase
MQQVQGIPNFFLHKNGTYYVRRMVRGERVWKSTGHKQFKSAFRRYNEILVELSQQRSGWKRKSVPTLNEWWGTYRESKQKSKETWAREESIMRLHVLPNLGRKDLDDFVQSDFEKHFKQRRKKVSLDTVAREMSLLRAVFEAAVDDELIDRNPLRKLAKPAYSTRTRVVTPAEQAAALAHMAPTVQRFFLFALGTGLRVSEIRGLRAADVFWEQNLIRVVGKGHNGEPKVREVPLIDADRLKGILKEQLAANLKHRRDAEKRLKVKPSGSFWTQSKRSLLRFLDLACKHADVEPFGNHTLRHTFATRYLQGGGDIYTLSKILGHSSVKVTEKVYAHLLTADLANLSRHVDLKLAPAVGTAEAVER